MYRSTDAMPGTDVPSAPAFRLRPEALDAPASGIVEVANLVWRTQGCIPLFVGEGDLPTPAFIAEAAKASLDRGETFYTFQRGLPELREALARYHEGLYGRSVSAERFFVTGSGMHAIQTAVRLVAGAGDEMIVPTPAWPNFAAAVSVSGATPICVPMSLTNGGWFLDLDRLAAAVTPATRAIFVNSPANPTGWTASHDELSAILSLARRHGLWIVADETYARFVYDGSGRAPSFREVMQDEDRILFVQTFSKNWAMTGWRVGWLEAPADLGPTIENLIQYSNSGVAAFMQRGAIAALNDGEAFVAEQVARAAHGRRIVMDGLRALPSVHFAENGGAFYLFFGVDGITDTRRLALDLVTEAGVGLSPGGAFGPGGAPYLRLCYARSADSLAEATRRLVRALSG